MANTVWHRSSSVLGVIIALLAVFTTFALIALDGPLSFGLAAVTALGIVVVALRLGQARKAPEVRS